MRILRVAQKLYPDEKGGGAYHAHAMSRDQAAMGHDVTVLTVGSGPPQERRDGYTVLRRPAVVEPLGNAVSPGVANTLRRAGSYDVVHAHSHLYFSTNLAALARRFTDTPLAITNHGLYSQTAPEEVFDAYLRTLGRWTFEQADVVFCYTETDKRRVRELGTSTRIEVIPNGIDTVRFTPDGPESELIDAGGPVVLFVGRFVEGKRPSAAVEAFAEALRERPGAELYLCGDGPLRSDLTSKVEDLGMDSSVTFLGHVPYDEMPSVYRSADVFVLPSRAEGVPRTVLEAMASGTPVIASDLPQIAPVVTEGGEVVSLEDPRALAVELERALADPAHLEETGASGREHVVSEYRWEETVAETTDVLSEITR